MMVVAILILWQIITSLLKMNNHSIEELETDFAVRFKENGISFIYWRNVMLPQISSSLLMYGVYLLINLFVLPSFKKISGEDIERLLSIRLVKAILSIILVSYLLAIGVNVISFYGQPHLFN